MSPFEMFIVVVTAIVFMNMVRWAVTHTVIYPLARWKCERLLRNPTMVPTTTLVVGNVGGLGMQPDDMTKMFELEQDLKLAALELPAECPPGSSMQAVLPCVARLVDVAQAYQQTTPPARRKQLRGIMAYRKASREPDPDEVDIG